jgi:hypothetical protein
LIVREAIREDIENLAHLMTELGYPSSTEDMGRRFEEISADPSYDTFIVEQDGEVLGMMGLYGALYTIRKSADPHCCCRKMSGMKPIRL